MWHFGKGQALRLGCPSIFITSPLVIWKLASPIFVSPLSPALPLILTHILILLVFPSLFIFLVVALFSPVMSYHILQFLKESFFLLTQEIITVGNMLRSPGGAAGSGDCVSAPAVRIVVTERRANTNVINTSALTPGTPCLFVFDGF